jgi:hypothetical protein
MKLLSDNINIYVFERQSSHDTVPDEFFMVLGKPGSSVREAVQIDAPLYATLCEFLTSTRDFIAPQDF